MPKITLVMPCSNGVTFIDQAINSVLGQSLQDWELLVSDDGSRDGTAEYLRSLSDPRIKIFFQPQNLGIFGNLNFLFSHAKSSITQILCQDDFLISSDALDKILALWADLPPKIAFLRCNHGCDGSSPLTRLERQVLPPVIEPKDSDLYFFLFSCIPGNLSNVSVRTSLIQEMGWYRTDLPYAGDFEFWSRTGRVRPWALNRSHVVHVRRHAGQASRNLNKRGELLPQVLPIIEGLFSSLRSQGHAPSDLRWYATTNYAARQMHTGVRGALQGGGLGYFRLVKRDFFENECFLGQGLSWFVYVVTEGGRFFAPTLARRLIKKHFRQHRSN